jgi:hypothetical protein
MANSVQEAAMKRELELLAGSFLRNYAPYNEVSNKAFVSQTPTCRIGALKHEKDAGMGGAQYWLTNDEMIRLMVDGYSGEVLRAEFVKK